MTDTASDPALDAPALLRLSSPADVVAAVPYLVGFQPAESIVLLSLRGRRHRVGLTLRVDLPPPEGRPAIVDGLVRHLHRDGALAAIAVIYTSQEVGAEVWPVLSRSLLDHRIAVREALRITGDRWWSFLCTVPACCPPTGTRILAPTAPGGPSRVGAELVSAGLTALGSREELVASVAPAVPAATSALGALLEEGAVDAVRRMVGPGGPAGCRRDWRQLVVRALQDPTGVHRPVLTDRRTADLLIALADIPTRDVAAAWAGGRGRVTGDQVVRLWLELTRRAPPPYDVAPATLLAHAAWYSGNGALARVAVDRALASDPNYRLAGLVERLLDEGVNPAMARRSRARPGGRRR